MTSVNRFRPERLCRSTRAYSRDASGHDCTRTSYIRTRRDIFGPYELAIICDASGSNIQSCVECLINPPGAGRVFDIRAYNGMLDKQHVDSDEPLPGEDSSFMMVISTQT